MTSKNKKMNEQEKKFEEISVNLYKVASKNTIDQCIDILSKKKTIDGAIFELRILKVGIDKLTTENFKVK